MLVNLVDVIDENSKLHNTHTQLEFVTVQLPLFFYHCSRTAMTQPGLSVRSQKIGVNAHFVVSFPNDSIELIIIEADY